MRNRWQSVDLNTKPVSKYVFGEFEAGFRIASHDRVPVYVERFDYGFRVFDDRDRSEPIATFGFFAFPQMLESISSIIMSEWERPIRGSNTAPDLSIYGGIADDDLRFDVYEWARKQTRISISSRVKVQWERLLSGASPLIVQLQKKVFCASHNPTAKSMFIPEIYEDKYVVSDVMNYRGAAVALQMLDDLTVSPRVRKIESDPSFLKVSEELKHLGLSERLQLNVKEDVSGMSGARAVDYMRNWQILFAMNGSPYRALNTTLQNLPGNVPPSFLVNLRYGRLLQPIFDRSPLILACSYFGIISGPMYGMIDPETEKKLDLIFLRATTSDVKKAIAMVARANHDVHSPRRSRHIYSLVNYLLDTPDINSTTLVGLTKAAIRYHREELEKHRSQEQKRVNLDARTAVPPIGFPTISGVRFLSTVGDIFEESAEMNHCVYSYATPAVSGEHYLFHVEKNGSSATMQVSPSGEILQCLGPRNRSNYATNWAKKAVRPWSKELRRAFLSGASPIVYQDTLYKDHCEYEAEFPF
jgi:hypothetical protein